MTEEDLLKDNPGGPMIDYEKHFFTLLTDWLELKKAHQELRNDFERVCDELADTKALLGEAAATLENVIAEIGGDNGTTA